MRRVLVLVEGPSDRGFVEELLRRLGFEPRVLIMRGNRPDKASRLINSQYEEYDKVIVLKDVHKAAMDA